MPSYNNFQSDNQKFSKSRTDIYNPNFENPICVNKDNEYIYKNLHKYAELISFLRWYPDIAYDMITPKTGKKLILDNDQRKTLRILVRYPDSYTCVIRGYGKTMLGIMADYHIARFFPDIKLSVTASTKESATSIWQAKHKELLGFFPSLADEIKIESFTKDRGYVLWVNGAEMDTLANSQQSKGQRRQRGHLEESNIIDAFTLEDAVLPIFIVPRITRGNEVDPEELNGQVNRYTTSGYKNSDEFDVIKKVSKNMIDNNGSWLVGSDWILPVYYGRQKKSVIDKARNGNLMLFKMNYLCEWVGCKTGALMNVTKLINSRILNRPIFEVEKDKKGKMLNVEYVFGIDVARSESDSNNKSAIVVLKIKRNKINKIIGVELINIVTPPNGLTYKEQSIIIKRMFYQYGGNLDDPDRSRVKAIVIDANGIGQGLIDEMVKDTIDPISNESLGCFGIINTNQETEIPNSPEFVYSFKAQGVNSAMIINFLNYCETDKLKMVKDFNTIRNEIPDKDKQKVEIACRQINSFIDEISNLQIKKINKGKDITVVQTLKKIDKDRYSATAMGLYYIDEFMNAEDINDVDDDDPLVYY